MSCYILSTTSLVSLLKKICAKQKNISDFIVDIFMGVENWSVWGINQWIPITINKTMLVCIFYA